MDTFSGFERKLANLLSQFPRIKKVAKKSYQWVIFFLSSRKGKFACPYNLRAIELNRESFFGYYDKSPLNVTNQYLLYHRSNIRTSGLPQVNIPVDIVVQDMKANKELFHLQSLAYNWQQGSRLHWLDMDRFIYNDFDSGRFVSRIGSIEAGGIISTVDFPIYDTHGDYALSLNFERLNILRPDYGYRNLAQKGKSDLFNLEEDGVFRVSLRTNELELIISLNDLKSYKLEVTDKCLHKVNHIMISPDGGKFIFLHRYFIKERKYDRLILATPDGQILKILADDQMVSHFCWIDNNTILAYMRQFSSGNQYYLIDTVTFKINALDIDLLGKYGDGHPSYNNGRILFDTYPNRARMKELMIYHMDRKYIQKVGEFFESFNYYGETRCDLHPRWSFDGKILFFDSVHMNMRQLYQLEMN